MGTAEGKRFSKNLTLGLAGSDFRGCSDKGYTANRAYNRTWREKQRAWLTDSAPGATKMRHGTHAERFHHSTARLGRCCRPSGSYFGCVDQCTRDEWL